MQFAPEMTLVCCGFDAAAGDKGSCQVSPTGFYQMTRMLKSLAGGRLVLTLEGGYKKEALELCSEAVMRALMDLPLPNAALDGLIPSDRFNVTRETACSARRNLCLWLPKLMMVLVSLTFSAIQDIKSALDVQKAHWKALQYRGMCNVILRRLCCFYGPSSPCYVIVVKLTLMFFDALLLFFDHWSSFRDEKKILPITFNSSVSRQCETHSSS